ncbi:hypothetical protein PAECIP111891_01057 [Paenibacillus allorhizoplanae]|uniref:Uncharacterized protein n=1 Tax=Paenibacillus allorhizoplanae TaxID=2905648 RepID=A0ABM9BXJ8_9BACL|nr:hypothetical protein [Paenibacillus allorhizoplanae]CAH1197087.1 hypothetical protein PAECIP111891_01057 [Paenibacillus allorhizoplanae]
MSYHWRRREAVDLGQRVIVGVETTWVSGRVVVAMRFVSMFALAECW